jgi:alcohol dehydrogenase
MTNFRAFRVEKTDTGFVRSVVERDEASLPAGDVLIDVRYSSVNFKDGLSATGNPGVTRNFPHTPGIDAAGIVLSSSDARFAAGDEVIVIGFDLGMNTSGGFAERVRVPAGWVVRRPAGLSLHESMILGTAGFTAALAVHKLEAVGLRPESGPVLVSGASGGVGSVAVRLLSHLGYEVAAVTGKPEQEAFLRGLGASRILSREEMRAGSEKPLLPEAWAGIVDTVGGTMLFNGVKSLRYGGSLAACGLVESPVIPATVLPFLLRHVNLLGIDSVQLPLPQKEEIWQKLAGPWYLRGLETLEERLTLDTLSDAIDRILAGRMVGRGVLHLAD